MSYDFTELQSGDDERQARELVGRVMSLLSAEQGTVPIRFLLRSAMGSVEMDFPGLRTAYSADIERRLSSEPRRRSGVAPAHGGAVRTDSASGVLAA